MRDIFNLKTKVTERKYIEALEDNIKELQAKNEKLEHAIGHALDCKDTKLCKECRWLLSEANDDNESSIAKEG